MTRKTALKLIFGGMLLSNLRAKARSEITRNGEIATPVPFKELTPEAQKAYRDAGVTTTTGDADMRLKFWNPPEEVTLDFNGAKRIRVNIAGKTIIFTAEEIPAALA